jgi:hypothetical protein
VLWSLPFALLLLVVVVLRYLRPGGRRCPECGARQTAEAPLCPQCGWIFSEPGDDDEWDSDTEWEPEADGPAPPAARSGP